jgi:hypothetical protein
MSTTFEKSEKMQWYPYKKHNPFFICKIYNGDKLAHVVIQGWDEKFCLQSYFFIRVMDAG